MNGRTALGAGFVLLAVLAGALFLDRAQRLVPVYAAARDLPAGTPLRSGDLMVVRVRLPDSSLRHYLRPGPDPAVAGRVLTAPVRRETLVPAELVLASSQQADLVELPVQADPGDMAQGLRPGDKVQVVAAYTDGARRGRAVVLLSTAEVVRVLEDPAGLTGTGQERGVQLRMPSDRAGRLMTQRQTQEDRLEGLADYLADGTLEKIEYLRQKKRLQARLDELDAQIASVRAAAPRRRLRGATLEELWAEWEQLDLDEQRAVLADHIDHIVVNCGRCWWCPVMAARR